MIVKEYIIKKSSDRAMKMIIKIWITIQRMKVGQKTSNQDFALILAHQRVECLIDTLTSLIESHSG